MTPPSIPSIAIACGGTGGHLFPGLAISEQLALHGCSITLFISSKEIDQLGARTAPNLDVVTLPAVGLGRGRACAFLLGFLRWYRGARKRFAAVPPFAALAMGGFTSAAPILAAKRAGARTFLHESNTVPGRANRWLARVVDEIFVGFPQAASRLHHRAVLVTGTPVRSRFQPRDAFPCRVALGLDPARPVLLVMGGSQGAGGINELILQSLPALVRQFPEIQLLHLTGSKDAGRVNSACQDLGVKAAVHPFFAGMELALGAATVAVSRAGASSLAELAAMRVPTILIPYPAATDNHQLSNARAFEQSGAARLLEQSRATPDTLAPLILDLLRNSPARESMKAALGQWHRPDAAEQMCREMLQTSASESALRPADPGTQGNSRPPRNAEDRRPLSIA